MVNDSPTFRNLQRDLAFVLYDVMGVDALCTRAPFDAHSRETFDAMLQAAIQLAAEAFEPLSARLDADEPHWDGKTVHILEEVKSALDAYVQGGFLAPAFPEADGGLGVPYTIHQAMIAAFHAGSPSISAYPLLTAAAANVLRVFGSEDQQRRYMAPMVEGRFFGTMCLSEPHAGSALADLRTRAVPQADGTYHIVGDKMWISGGEHELSENIVHLVLARLPDAPPGVKGISMFIVPRYRVDAAGASGDANGVVLTGLNHKMGYRGTVNTALAFGEEAPAIGELVGEPNRGLSYMFQMMNEARVGVGLGATMLAYAGYRTSLDYARERVQGRHPDQRDPASAPVPIIEHTDVRRMLLTQKVFAEGGLALAIYCARLIDEQHAAPDEATREQNEDLLQILTPIAKAWPSEHGPRANDHAIQVLGGCGYTRDFPVERYYRDNRLNPIHEGTNGIQGLDLLGRKVTMHQGRAFRTLLSTISERIGAVRGPEAIEGFCQQLEAALATVTETTLTVTGAALKGEIRLFLANATEYLHMLGHVVVAWMWLEQAAAAQRGLDAGVGARDFLQGKLHATRFFFRYELPRIERQAKLLKSLDDTALTMPDAGF